MSVSPPGSFGGGRDDDLVPPRPQGVADPSQIQYPFWSGDWDLPQRYQTILFADFNGDGQAELLGRSSGGMIAFQYDPQIMQFRSQYLDESQGWLPMPPGPPWTDVNDTTQGSAYNNSWNHERYYATIRAGDVDGDGQAELVARWWDGIHVYKWIAFTNADSGEKRYGWLPVDIPTLPLSDALGWSQAVFYESIQLADIDGDGRAELLGRGPGGLSAWKFTSTGWDQLGPVPTLEYYDVIRLADIDGDGREELVGRAGDGIEVWQWDGSSWNQLSGGSDSFSLWDDAQGWSQPQYYETIRLADVDGDGKAELLGRGAGGIEVWTWSGTTWTQVDAGSLWSDAQGWGEPEYYETIRLADVDGDGQDELLGRGAAGMEAWKWSGGGWNALGTGGSPPWSDAASWNLQQYYETIQLADVDGDGRAELFGLGPDMVEIWKYDAGSAQWYRPTAGFPPFTGGQLTAYQTLSGMLTRDTNVGLTGDVRGVYDQINDLATFQDWQQSIPGLPVPAGISAADWSAVTSQIALESRLLATTLAYFSNQILSFYQQLQSLRQSGLQSAFLGLQADAEKAFNAASAALSLEEAIWSTVTASLGAALAVSSAALGVGAGIVAAPFTAGLSIPAGVFVGLAGASLGFAVASGGANAAWGALSWLGVTKGASFETATEIATSELETELTTLYTTWLTGFGAVQSSVVEDYGLLNVFGADIASSTPQDQSAALSAGADAYELYCWQVLSPTVWRVREDSYGSKYPSSYNLDLAPYGGRGTLSVWVEPNDKGNPVKPDLSNLQRIYDASDAQPPGLAQELPDVLFGGNGWQLPNTSKFTDEYPDLGDLYTTASLAPATPASGRRPSRRPLYAVDATATLTRSGAGEVIAEVALHNRSATAVSHVRIDRANLALADIAAPLLPRRFDPSIGLPGRRRRMGRGHWARERLVFRVPPDLLDREAGSLLEVSGSFLAPQSDGAWQRLEFAGRISFRTGGELEGGGATFLSIDERLAELRATVAGDPRLREYQRTLPRVLDRAMARLDAAARACAASNQKRAKMQLGNAGNAVEAYTRQLRATRARNRLRGVPELRQALLASGVAILRDMRALRRGSECRADVVVRGAPEVVGEAVGRRTRRLRQR